MGAIDSRRGALGDFESRGYRKPTLAIGLMLRLILELAVSLEKACGWGEVRRGPLRLRLTGLLLTYLVSDELTRRGAVPQAQVESVETLFEW